MKRRILLAAMAVLGALATASIAFSLMRVRYADKLASRVWASTAPAGATVHHAEVRADSLLMLGDSRIAEWGRPIISGWNVINEAVGGMTSSECTAHCGAALTRTHPGLVVVQIGINDLKLLGVRPQLRQSVVDHCISNIETIVDGCREAGATVIVTPIWPAGEIRFPRCLVWSSEVDESVSQVNGILAKRFSGQPGVHVIDLFAILEQRREISHARKLYRNDLHLTNEAYEHLSVALARVIPLLGSSPSNGMQP